MYEFIFKFGRCDIEINAQIVIYFIWIFIQFEEISIQMIHISLIQLEDVIGSRIVSNICFVLIITPLK